MRVWAGTGNLVLSAIVAVLLGAGMNFGWHYLVDSAGATALTLATAVVAA